MIYDITRTIAPTLKVWPGDTPFAINWVITKAGGSSVNLSTLTLSAHTGTHADAPYHYTNMGEHPAELPLEPYIGRVYVASIDRQAGGIVPADFAHHALTQVERLLVHTWYSEVPDEAWREDFPYPTVEFIDWLGQLGCSLLGVDMPSVDDFNSKDLPCHHRLRDHRILNLEHLNLRGVPDGEYELIALPLKIAGACGSPVRAILRSL
jgi:arylformamidase